MRQARVVMAGNAAAAGQKPKRPIRRVRKNERLTNKQLTQDNYFGEQEIRNDPQNVHETQVNNDMLRIYQNVAHRNDQDPEFMNVNNQNPGANSISEIREYAKTYKFADPKHRDRALKTINKMAEGNWITNLHARESDILDNVWKRSKSADNRANQAELRAALMDSLADCVESGYNGQDYQVCASGRTARVLNSLTLLDTDEKISAPVRTAEILRNEVFTKSHKIIQDALKETDDETARAYNGALETPAPDVEYKVKAFEAHVKERINNTLRDEYHDVDQKVLTNLITDAQAGV